MLADASAGEPASADKALIAQVLGEMAALLEAQDGNPFRVAAYRRAADTVARLAQPLRQIHASAGEAGLDALAGIGPRRAAAIRAALTEMLDRRRRLRQGAAPRVEGAEPPVGTLLDVDREYRQGAQAGTLPMIAPKRFNPEGKAWLPVLHTERPHWHFTALYSNTARAHELDRVHDWVVVYAEDAQHHERPCTVVTAGRGALVGQRVVRGREAECRDWSAQASPSASSSIAQAQSARRRGD